MEYKRIMKHQILGKKIEYEKLNAKQQEAYNLQMVSSIFAEYGYLVIKLSDDWNDADFIALEFGTDNFLKVQLKGRFGFFKKYIGKNIYICFCDRSTNSWYLYPHDDLCELFMEKYKNTDSWKNQGAYSWPVLSTEHKEQLKQYLLNEYNDKNNTVQHVPKTKVSKEQFVENKKIGKNGAIKIINQKLSLNISNNNSAYSSINASVEQWSFNIDNSYFDNDFYIILEDQGSKKLYCFCLKKGTIKNPVNTFNQRNDGKRKNASIIIIPRNDRNFTNNWKKRDFQFLNYKILEMDYSKNNKMN